MNLIVAADLNWGIGRNNELLAKIPRDLKQFCEKTMGKIVVMGRRTLQSFPDGMPLRGRTNIVLTRNPGFHAESTIIVHSLEETQTALKRYIGRDVYIIGGESIYRLFLPYCDTAYVTKILHRFDADTFFPDLDKAEEWERVSESEEQMDQGIRYAFLTYKKGRAKAADFLHNGTEGREMDL